ncbi:peptide-methionine (S)-S-oxide reductase MsrA [Antarcticibacterium flavum]|uniref:Peptide methionine sulfoxide reductase MsrA n=1 Tax=Antarcticibacterium flavum TaxID=2058175 RepID=A0A5B7X981_9FLAO|nr:MULTISPECIES: peptide-methionine (S)-S-oxide reductase MsrA [Antarcticibacterium]MCM4160333.1 peptide-methionine (S)-S-oxide reductase [Antarcticibacterium sp. W02-3]QCY71288.1 peptide-methionine (S)-S-oxide reductase MsrA [Antarcticibacterium flavum]
MEKENLEIAILAGGCFWCTEAVFQRVEGVEEVVPGFTGGQIKNPAYREIITGRTGHAEAIEIRFDPTVITFEELLYIFFSTHDPTTLNRQQYDVGTQYRSAIFYQNDEQKEVATRVIEKIEQEKIFDDRIVTEVTQAGPFYKAEQEHLDYYNRNREQRYCQAIIDPKIKKLKEKFANRLKSTL